MLKLQLMYKETVLKEFLTDKAEFLVGRDPGCDLCIDNLAASSRHARIFKGSDVYAIEDLNSTNGTYLNGQEIKTQILKNNDQITIGKHTISVSYQVDDAFKEENPNSVSQSTYMIAPEELKRLMN